MVMFGWYRRRGLNYFEPAKNRCHPVVKYQRHVAAALTSAAWLLIEMELVGKHRGVKV